MKWIESAEVSCQVIMNYWYNFMRRFLKEVGVRQIIGPDVSFYQDDPGTPQEINFVRMNEATDFVIILAGQNIWIEDDRGTHMIKHE